MADPLGPPSPDLGYGYHTAAFAYYYFYHKKSTIIWGDVGAYWGHYDQDDYSTTLDEGYGATWPTLKNATLFGEYYDTYTPPPPPAGGFTHDPFPAPPYAPDGLYTYEDIQADVVACYNSLGDDSGYPVDEVWTGTFVGTHPSFGAVYEVELSGTDPAPGKYFIDGDAVLSGTLTLTGGPDDVWIFQVDGNLYARGGSKVVMAGGARAQNVWWQVRVPYPYGYYEYDYETYSYTISYMPGAYIGDDPSYPPYSDPASTGYAAFCGNVMCNGDVAIGRGSSVVGRVMSVNYGWWFYATIVYGSVTINPTDPLPMATANNFAVLAMNDVVNSGETEVKGRVGVSTGTSHGSDPLYVDPPEFWLADSDPTSDVAISSAASAGALAAARDIDYDLTGEKLQGKRLPPGVYLIDGAAFTGSVETDGPIILDGLNDPASVWIFRTTGPISFSASDGVVQFIYDNGADPDNVFWICTTAYVAPSVSIRGTILASSSSASAIDLDTDAVVQGRVVATAGSIQLHGNTVFSNSSGGALDWVVTSNPDATANDEAVSVATDGLNLYVLGFVGGSGSGTDNSWRLERRSLTDGALLASVTWNPGTGEDLPRKVLVDGSGVYVFGSTETGLGTATYQWRLEKRSLSTLALDGSFTTYTSTLPYGGLAADIGLDGSTIYLFGEMNDILPSATTRLRYEKRSTTSGALVPGSFQSPDTWYEGGTYTTVDPGRSADFPATAEGVVVDYSTFGRGARCLAVVPSPSAPDSSAPFLIAGGWQDYFGFFSAALYQKRFLSDGALDVGDGSLVPPYPGYDPSDADGTLLVFWGSAFGAKNCVESIVHDGVHSYGLLSVDYAGAPYFGFTPEAGKFYWCVEKRTMVPHPPGIDPVLDPSVSGGQLVGDPHYALGIYGPVPCADSERDYSCGAAAMDEAAKRFFLVSPSTADLGGLQWRIEKRKASSIVLDALFNADGERPGLIEADPSPGTAAIPEQWYVYDYSTYTYHWTSMDPATDPDLIWVVDWGWSPPEAYHTAPVPATPGAPDRCRGVTFHLDKMYVVGSDSTDVPASGTKGQWRIECRFK